MLNPALHSRIFFKESISQQKAGMRVAICGISNQAAPHSYQGIEIYPFSDIRRTSWKRIFRPWQVVIQALSLRADVCVLHTPELILPALFFLPLRKIVYDVHEDYLQNILSGNTYPSWARPMLAYFVRKMESFFVKKIAGVTVAENIFYPIFSEKAKQTMVLQNKFLPPNFVKIPPKKQINKPLRFILTGNLSADWGLFRAIYTFREVIAVEESCLTIAGFCPQKVDYEHAISLIREFGLSTSICWIGGLKQVDYQEIINLISTADIGFALYEPTPNIVTRVPTKFFEYLALRTPLIFTDAAEWCDFSEKYHLGFDIKQFHNILIERTLRNHLQLFQNQQPVDESVWSWESEAVKMNHFYSKIFGAIRR